MIVLLTCKNEDLIKYQGARVLISLYIDFSEAQKQLTPQSMVESRQKFKLIKLLWLLPARMKTIKTKMKAPEC